MFLSLFPAAASSTARPHRGPPAAAGAAAPSEDWRRFCAQRKVATSARSARVPALRRRPGPRGRGAAGWGAAASPVWGTGGAFLRAGPGCPRPRLPAPAQTGREGVSVGEGVRVKQRSGSRRPRTGLRRTGSTRASLSGGSVGAASACGARSGAWGGFRASGASSAACAQAGWGWPERKRHHAPNTG